MTKKILIITGAGASKSLTTSLTKEEKVDLIGYGGFREMPTGDELIQNISSYQDKSIVWLNAYLCYTFLNKKIDSNLNKGFIQFALFLENTRYEDAKIYKEAGDIFTGMDQSAQYQDFIIKGRLKLKQATKKTAEKIVDFKEAAKVIHCHNMPHELNMSELLNSSKYLQLIIENFDAEITTMMSLHSYADEIFYYLIFYSVASDATIFRQLKPLLDIKYSPLLNFILNNIFQTVKTLTQKVCELYSNGVGQGFNNSRRFKDNTVVANSIYETRLKAFEDIVEKAQEVLNKYNQPSQISNIIEKLRKVLENINKFSAGLSDVIKLTLLVKPTYSIDGGIPDCGQTQSLTEFRGLFGIENIDVSFRKHDVTNLTLEKVVSCYETLLQTLKSLEESVQNNDLKNNFELLSLVIQKLEDNGFKQQRNNNALIISVNLLFDAIARFMHKSIFDPITITEDNTPIKNMKGCYISASVVNHYKPYSIDYFMMNLKSIAPYEFIDSILEEDIRKNIHIYTKYIIADILMGTLKYVYHGRNEDSYLKRLLWRLLEYSHFYGMTLEEFLCDSVKIINFNYELSLILMLLDHLSLKSVNTFLDKKLLYGVYGGLLIENKINTRGHENKTKYMFDQHDIWHALFNINPRDGYPLYQNLQQINERITWIGEDKDNELKLRPDLQQAFIDADEIYFLGFGFDGNNLYNLGIIDKNHKLEENLKTNLANKKILISGGNAKIISTVKNVFGISDQTIINKLFHLKNNEDLNIYISQDYLPNALIYDL